MQNTCYTVFEMLVDRPTTQRPRYFLFKTCRVLINRRVRGSYRLYRILCRTGVFGSFAYHIGQALFHVPVSNPDNAWASDDVERYETSVLDSFSAVIRMFPDNDTAFIDCGADIGTFSALLFARVPGIREIVAIEPRSEVLPWLRRNLDALHVKTRTVAGAVSDFMGRGLVRASPIDPSGHACFLVPDPDGDIAVVTVDSLGITSSCVALKIDVEGAELQVLKGAHRLLSRARQFAVVVEANLEASGRSGTDPIEFLRFLSSIRRCEFRVAETGAAVDLSKSFSAQSTLRNSNIVAWTPGPDENLGRTGRLARLSVGQAVSPAVSPARLGHAFYPAGFAPPTGDMAVGNRDGPRVMAGTQGPGTV